MGQDYDRVFRENMGQAFLPLTEKYCGFKVLEAEELDSKLQVTIDREVDFARMVKTANGEEFIFHLEVQGTNDQKMLRRMRLYHALLEEVYDKRVEQYVLYHGQVRPTMRTRWEPREVMRGFDMLDIPGIDFRKFLASEIPEELIMGIMADFQGHPPRAVMQLIMQKLFKMRSSGSDRDRYLRQLGVFARNKKLEKEFKEVLEVMPGYFNIQEDYLYQEGKAKGEEMAKRASALKMLKRGKLSEEEISEDLDLPLETIVELRLSLNHKGKVEKNKA